MAYADNTDVQALLTLVDIEFGVTTGAPSTATVDTWCNRWSLVLDGVLRPLRFGTVPVTDADDIAFLAPYVAMRAAWDVWTKVYPNEQDQPEHVDVWLGEWKWLIENLQAKKVFLPTQNAGVGTARIIRAKIYDGT